MQKFIFFILIVILFIGCASNNLNTLSNVQQPVADSSTQVEKKLQTKIDTREKAIQHFLTGENFKNNNDYENAVIEYLEALQYDNDIEFYSSIADCYINLNKFNLAEKYAKILVEKDPQNPNYRNMLGNVYWGLYKLKEAEIELQEAIKLDEENINYWQMLASIQEYTSQENAFNTYKKIVEKFGDNPYYLDRISEIANVLGKHQEAIYALENILKLEPNDKGTKMKLAVEYADIGKDSLSENIFEDITSDDDTAAKLTYIRFLMKQKKFKRANEIFYPIIFSDSLSFEKKLEIAKNTLPFNDSTIIDTVFRYYKYLNSLDTNSWQPYYAFAIIHSQKKDFQNAILYYRKVIQLEPELVDIWLELARTYEEMKQKDSTEIVLEEAKKTFPKNFLINYALGIVYFQNKKSEQAIRPLEDALKIAPQNIETISLLASIYDAQKNWERSDELYEIALTIDSTNSVILNNYGYSLATRGKELEKALNMTKKAIEEKPKNPSYLDTIGWIYFQLGNYDEAKKFIQDAIDLENNNAEINEHLGDIYSKLNDSTNAIKFWEKAFELDSQRIYLQKKIEREK